MRPLWDACLMKVRLGTRASGLTRALSEAVMDRLREHAAGLGTDLSVSVIPVTAETDGLHGAEDEPHAIFVGALRVALLSGECDVVVHSLADVWHSPHPDLRFAATVSRNDPVDAVLTAGPALADLEPGARVALKGARRVAQLLRLHPDVNPLDAYGSLSSRVERLRGGDVEALVAPRAHLDVLGISFTGVHDFSMEEMLPGPGDGVLVIEVRADAPDELVGLIETLDHPGSRAAAAAECAAFETLGGDDSAAIGTYAVMDGGLLRVQVRVLSPRGALMLNEFSHGHPEDAAVLGRQAALALLGRGARMVLGAER